MCNAWMPWRKSEGGGRDVVAWSFLMDVARFFSSPLPKIRSRKGGME